MRRLWLVGMACAACSTDTFGSGDAASDAQSLDGGSVFCNGAPAGTLFCDDFESSPSAGMKWQATVQGSGTISLDTTNYVSPTHAANFNIPPNAAIGTTTLGTTVSNVQGNKLSMRAQLRINTIDPSQGVILMAMSYAAATPGGTAAFDILAYKGNLEVQAIYGGFDGGLTAETFPLPMYSTNAWIPIVVDTTPTTVGTFVTHIRVTIDGSVAGDFDTRAPRPIDSTRAFGIGATFGPPLLANAVVEFDDVLLIAPP